MYKHLIAVLTVVFLAHSSSAEKRTIACKTPVIATTCYWTHGRLSIYNGAVNWRL